MRLMRAGFVSRPAISRRAFLALTPSVALAQDAQPGTKGRSFPPDWRKYADPSTEFEVLRFTSPEYETFLPPAPARCVTRRGGDVLVACSRAGSLQAQLIDIDKGDSRVLTDAAALDASSLTLSPDDRYAYYFDGDRLQSVALAGLRTQTLCSVRDGWTRSGPVAVAADNLSVYFAESSGKQSEIRRANRTRSTADTILAADSGIRCPTPNPRRAMLVWLSDDARAWVATLDGQGMRALQTPPGQVLQALWSPDGQSVIYLLQPDDPRELVQIREQALDGRADRLVAKTSQFAAFQRNHDGSVFVGASRNKAAPCVLVLLRTTRREFTLCEHAASIPAATSPTFSPNSRWIFFQSDRHGKPALYGIKVEKLIETTED